MIELEQKSELDMARLNALLIVTNAYDADKIQKRNLQAIDEQISRSVQEVVRDANPRLQTLLYEEIEAESVGQPNMRELPIPPHTKWNKKLGLKPLKRKRTDSRM